MEFPEKPKESRKFDVRIKLLSLPEPERRDCAPCLATEHAIEELGRKMDVQLTVVVPSKDSKDALAAFGVQDFQAPVTIIEKGGKTKRLEGVVTLSQLEREVRDL